MSCFKYFNIKNKETLSMMKEVYAIKEKRSLKYEKNNN